MTLINDGNAIEQVVFLVQNNPNAGPTPSLPSVTLKECCDDFSLKVLADTSSTDNLNNDVNGFLWKFDNTYSGATMYLQKISSTGWNNVATLNSNTYGTFKAFGFNVNSEGESYIGYQLEWRKVLNAFGEGGYRIKITSNSSIIGAIDDYSFRYCLAQYTSDRANGTVRIEFKNNQLIGDKYNDKKFFDYRNIYWYNSIRLQGVFGYPTTPINREYNQYDDGLRVEVSDMMEPEYVLKTKFLNIYAHTILQYQMMQADEIWITDYNSNNVESWVNKYVQPTSEYSPGWKPLLNRLAPIELKFRQSSNRLLKRFQ